MAETVEIQETEKPVEMAKFNPEEKQPAPKEEEMAKFNDDKDKDKDKDKNKKEGPKPQQQPVKDDKDDKDDKDGHYPDQMEDMQNLFDGKEMDLDEVESYWNGWSNANHDIDKITANSQEGFIEVEFKGGTKVKDSGNKMSAAGPGGKVPSSEDFDRMVNAAKDRDWRAISIGQDSSEEFKRRLYLACARAGLKPIGYKPTPELKALGMEMAQQNGHNSWGADKQGVENVGSEGTQQGAPQGEKPDNYITGGDSSGDTDGETGDDTTGDGGTGAQPKDTEQDAEVKTDPKVVTPKGGKDTKEDKESRKKDEKEKSGQEKPKEKSGQEKTEPQKDAVQQGMDQIDLASKKVLSNLAKKEQAELSGLKKRVDNKQFAAWNKEFKSLQSNPPEKPTKHQEKVLRNAKKYGYDKAEAMPKDAKIDYKDYDNGIRKGYTVERAVRKNRNDLTGTATQMATLKAKNQLLDNPDKAPTVTADSLGKESAGFETKLKRQAILEDEKKAMNGEWKKADTPEKKQAFEKKMEGLEGKVYSGAMDKTADGKPRQPSAASTQYVKSVNMEDVRRDTKKVNQTLESGNYKGAGQPVKSTDPKAKTNISSAEKQQGQRRDDRLQKQAITKKALDKRLKGM